MSCWWMTVNSSFFAGCIDDNRIRSLLKVLSLRRASMPSYTEVFLKIYFQAPPSSIRSDCTDSLAVDRLLRQVEELSTQTVGTPEIAADRKRVVQGESVAELAGGNG